MKFSSVPRGNLEICVPASVYMNYEGEMDPEYTNFELEGMLFEASAQSIDEFLQTGHIPKQVKEGLHTMRNIRYAMRAMHGKKVPKEILRKALDELFEEFDEA